MGRLSAARGPDLSEGALRDQSRLAFASRAVDSPSHQMVTSRRRLFISTKFGIYWGRWPSAKLATSRSARFSLPRVRN